MKLFFVGLIALAIIVLIAVRLYRDWIPLELKAASGGPPGQAITRKVSDVDAIFIKLDINAKPSLAVVLSADGSINRMGTGTLENTEHDLFVGRTDPAIFQAVRSHLTEAMLQLLGLTFHKQNPRGAPCELTLTFQFKDNTSDGFVIFYGAESEGPPGDVASFVRAAVIQTDPWYRNFKRTAAGRKQP
jgi:hypothetical protein